MEYDCSPFVKSKGFTGLMHLVLKTKENPELNDKIQYFTKDEINAKNDKGWTPLLLACRNSKTLSSNDTVKLLLKYGADINDQQCDGWTALMMACRYESTVETVKILLAHQCDIYLKNNFGSTSFKLACDDGNMDTIQLLFDYMIKNQDEHVFIKQFINSKDENGWTILMNAVGNQNLILCKFLIEPLL